MLRYQNKYRAILRKKPDLIDQVCRELRQEGLPCPDVKVTVSPLPKDDPPMQTDPNVQAILRAAASLARRVGDPAPENDRLRVQAGSALIQGGDLQLAAKALCRTQGVLGSEIGGKRNGKLPHSAISLSEHMAKLETLPGSYGQDFRKVVFPKFLS
jgi:hypothetical protein